MKENDLKHIRAHHETLKQYEGTYEINKKNFLNDLSLQNKVEVHANRATRSNNTRTIEHLVKDKYRLDDHVLQSANRLQANKDENKKAMLFNAQVKQMNDNKAKKQQAAIKEKI